MEERAVLVAASTDEPPSRLAALRRDAAARASPENPLRSLHPLDQAILRRAAEIARERGASTFNDDVAALAEATALSIPSGMVYLLGGTESGAPIIGSRITLVGIANEGGRSEIVLLDWETGRVTERLGGFRDVR